MKPSKVDFIVMKLFKFWLPSPVKLRHVLLSDRLETTSSGCIRSTHESVAERKILFGRSIHI